MEKLKKKAKNYKDIIKHIIYLIQTGELKPGDKLPGERNLATYSNVGRHVVRTALKFLSFFDIVRIEMGKGVFINKPTPMMNILSLLEVDKKEPLEDLINARKPIESQMASLAARNANDKDIEDMEKALLEMEGDIERKNVVVQSTDKFHLAIYQASKNIILYRIGLYICELMHESRTYSLGGRRSFNSLKEHKEIFEAIKNKDENKAYLLMNKHLENAERSLKKRGVI